MGKALRVIPAGTAAPLPPLAPHYLPALPTPGTLRAGYVELAPHGPAFSYPHAPAIFPAYRVEYAPGPFQETCDTRLVAFSDWQLRVAH